jgi:hypothetical protein
VPVFSNLELLLTVEGKRIDGLFHCKVESTVTDTNKRFLVHFTSMSPSVETFIRSLVGRADSKSGDWPPTRSAALITERLRSQ